MSSRKNLTSMEWKDWKWKWATQMERINSKWDDFELPRKAHRFNHFRELNIEIIKTNRGRKSQPSFVYIFHLHKDKLVRLIGRTHAIWSTLTMAWLTSIFAQMNSVTALSSAKPLFSTCLGTAPQTSTTQMLHTRWVCSWECSRRHRVDWLSSQSFDNSVHGLSRQSIAIAHVAISLKADNETTEWSFYSTENHNGVLKENEACSANNDLLHCKC